MTNPVGLGCLLAVTRPKPWWSIVCIYIHDEYILMTNINAILFHYLHFVFCYDINRYIFSATIYLWFSSASSWPTCKTYVRMVATTALLDPVRHTAQAMVLLKPIHNTMVKASSSLFLAWVGYTWIYLAWLATIQPAFPRKVGAPTGLVHYFITGLLPTVYKSLWWGT